MENDISMSEEAKHRLRKRRVLKLSAFLFVSLLNRKRAAKYISIVSNIIMIGQSFTF